MKLNAILAGALLALTQTVLAAPTPSKTSPLVKRASVSDVPDTGYATLNGGTTGGNGGTVTTVTSYAQFTDAATDDEPRIIIVDGTIRQNADQVRVGANKTILGKNYNAVLEGFGLLIKKPNVIVRNLTIRKVLADNGDAIGIQGTEAKNIWIDHCDLSSDMDHDKDYYDGLLDITHAAEYITLSNNFLHDHYKASLVGHSDNNEDEDTGHLLITYANNFWLNLNSRGPSFRFGTGHIFNNYYENVGDAINVRRNGQVLVESNVFSDVKKPLYSVDDEGGAVERDNDFGGGENTAPSGSLNSVPYQYSLLGSGNVKNAVVGTAGATLTF
ncbi:hypothetical protein VTO42DRAFT_8000 [Malbranchea cinnamomea]